MAWQRIAEKFNLTSSVKVMREQCSNKWKKLEENYRKVQEHNDKTGSEQKERNFQQELEEFFGTDPKIIPMAAVSSWQQSRPQAICQRVMRRNYLWKAAESHQRRRNYARKLSATEMIEFLTEYKEEKRKEEEAKIVLAQKMDNGKNGHNGEIP